MLVTKLPALPMYNQKLLPAHALFRRFKLENVDAIRQVRGIKSLCLLSRVKCASDNFSAELVDHAAHYGVRKGSGKPYQQFAISGYRIYAHPISQISFDTCYNISWQVLRGIQ